MKKLPLSSLILLMCLLCALPAAKGQPTLSIIGPTTVCPGNSYTYGVSVAGQQPEYYNPWTVQNGAVGVEFTETSKTVVWGIAGPGKIIATAEVNWGGVMTTISGYLDVTVMPLPIPYITADKRMACEPLDNLPPDILPPQFLDSPCQKVCAYSRVTYTANGQPGSSFLFTVAGGLMVSNTANTVTVDWLGAGPGKVSVMETTVYGCTNDAYICIDIKEGPQANFGALPDTSLKTIDVCKGTEVVFIDNSTYDPQIPIVAWRWDFGDGTWSNEKGGPWAPIVHAYTTSGTYKAILTVTNQCGCESSDTMTVEVHPDPGVEIVCPSVVCENSTYMYHVNATCPSGTWTVIGGTVTSPSYQALTITWDDVDPVTGMGYIIYNPAGSCPGMCPYPVAKKIPVVMQDAEIQGPQYVCPGQQYLYRLPQWPTTKYHWSANSTNVVLQPTDQPNEIAFTANVTGTITLKCIYNNQLLGCNSTVTRTINAGQGVAFTDTTWEYCLGVEKVFHLTGGNSNTAMWTLMKPDNTKLTGGPGQFFTATLDQVGKYWLSVKGDFCPNQPQEIKVLAKPDMPEYILGPDNNRLCRGIPTTFSTGNADPKHVFVWEVTEGSLNIPVGSVTDVTLDLAGDFTDTLRVYRVTKEKPYCRSDPREVILTRDIPLFTVMGPNTVCPSQYYGYNVGFDKGEEYEWRIYPQTMGSVDSGQGTKNAKILWNKQGGNASLVCGVRKCDSMVYDTLAVYIRPLALTLNLSDDTICMGRGIHAVVNVSTGGVKWNNGISIFESEPGSDTTAMYFDKPIKNYTTYNVTALVENPWGCETPISAQANITVIPTPAVYVTPLLSIQANCQPVNVPLTVMRDTSGIPPLTYAWAKHGVPIGTADSFYHATDTGRYDVAVTGAFAGCPAYLNAKILPMCHPNGGGGGIGGWPIEPRCLGSASIEVIHFNACAGTVHLKRYLHNPSAFVSGGWPVLGNDVKLETVIGDSIAHYRILKAGAHRFQYNAVFEDNMDDYCYLHPDTTLVVKILPALEIVQLCDDSAGYRKIRLVDRSTAIEPITYRFFQHKVDTSYPIIVEGANVTYADIWLAPTSTKKFGLGVYTANGSCWTYPQTAIWQVPDADFSFERPITCEKDAAVYFTNNSMPSGNLSSLWSFGDGSLNTQKDPYRVYDQPGSGGDPYNVKLVVADMWGCKDSVDNDVMIVTDDHRGRVTISPNFPCQHTTATATHAPNTSTTPAVSYDWWDMNKSIKKPGGSTLSVTRSGYYFVHTEDQYGCKEAAPGDTVLFTRVAPAVIYGGQSQCQGVPFTLSGYAGQVPGILYSWERDGSTLTGVTSAELSETLNSPGTYKYRLTTSVPNPGGGYCDDVSEEFKVEVHATPAKPKIAFSIPDCNDYTVELDVSPSYPGEYNWSNGMTGLPIQVKHGGPFQVTYTDLNGCKSDSAVRTPRDLRSYLWIFPTGCYSLCATDPNIIAGPIIPFNKWDYLHNGSSFAGAAPGSFYDVSLNPTGAGVYNMYLEDDWCDVTSGDMNVDYNCEPLGPGSVGATKYGIHSDREQQEHAELLLAPNPAGNDTRLSYNYTPGKVPGYIAVYDVLGRVVFDKQLTEAKGSFDISLVNFATGTYNVVLRRGGETILHRTLNVTR